MMLLGRYEWPVLLGLGTCAAAPFFKSIALRFMAIYAVGVLFAYSLVHYKTPWCIISIIWPFLFLFGVALLAISIRQRLLAWLTASVLLGVSLGSTIWLNYFYCTTDTEPYVYVQTYNDIRKLTGPLSRLTKQNPSYYQMVGHIIRTSTYPIPWLLGDFSRVGYYEHENLPEQLDADFLLVQGDRVEEIEKKLQGTYYTDSLTIRPYQDTSKVYFNAKIFKNFFPNRPPDFVGKKSS